MALNAFTAGHDAQALFETFVEIMEHNFEFIHILAAWVQWVNDIIFDNYQPQKKYIELAAHLLSCFFVTHLS